jgi:hypothetical protein
VRKTKRAIRVLAIFVSAMLLTGWIHDWYRGISLRPILDFLPTIVGSLIGATLAVQFDNETTK